MTALDIVRQYYAAFNARHWAGMLDLLAPDVRHEPNQGVVRVGKEKYAQFLQHMDDAYDEQLHDLVLMTDESGHRVAAEFVIRGVYKKGEAGLPPAHGQRYELPVGAFLEVKEGRITRVTTYYNLDLWIKLVL
jgi:steroid delta-isomerase-like uncharacterized protein